MNVLHAVAKDVADLHDKSPAFTKESALTEKGEVVARHDGLYTSHLRSEGDLFRKVLGWSLVLILAMCVLVYLQSTAVLDWMVVK